MPKKLSKCPDYTTTQKVHSEDLEWLKWLDWPSVSLFARAYQTTQLPKDKKKPALKKIILFSGEYQDLSVSKQLI